MGAFVAVFFPLLMAFTAFFDLFTMRIPNWISIALIALFLGLSILTGMPFAEIGMHLLAGAVVLIIGFTLFALRIIGGGDAKVAAAIALWMGFGNMLAFLFYASLLGGVLTLIIILLRHALPQAALPHWVWLVRLHDKKQGVPYGIALAIGALITYSQTVIYANILLLG